MSEKTRLGKAITYLLAKHKWSQTKLCEVTGITSSVASETINKDKRPEVRTLVKLCTCWPDAESIHYALSEHMKDECELINEPKAFGLSDMWYAFNAGGYAAYNKPHRKISNFN